MRFKEAVILPRIIPREEIERLLNYMYKNENRNSERAYKCWLRDTAVIETFFATGARVHEVSNIRADNVNLEHGAYKNHGEGREGAIYPDRCG